MTIKTLPLKLSEEYQRVLSLLDEYETIGFAGEFARRSIKAVLSRADYIMTKNDAVGMMCSLRELKGCK